MSNILVIDENNPEIGLLLQAIFQKYSQDVVTVVMSMQGAFEQIEQNTPDIIFICSRMIQKLRDDSSDRVEQFINSIDFYRQIQKQWPDLNLPVVTVSLSSNEQQKIKDAGLSGNIQLPYTPQDFLEARNAVLAGKRYFPRL